VAVGAESFVEGRMLTTRIAGPGTISLPVGPSFVNFRTVSSLSCPAGGLGNTGILIIMEILLLV
jgi:hypothetical protein